MKYEIRKAQKSGEFLVLPKSLIHSIRMTKMIMGLMIVLMKIDITRLGMMMAV